MAIAAIDANVLVGLLDSHDQWHPAAVTLRDALCEAGVEPVYFDCVLNETITVLARRVREQGQPEQLGVVLDQLARLILADDITWISRGIQRLYHQVVSLVRSSSGALDFHNSLMALVCREMGISAVISFDRDFDQVDWLIRAGSATELSAALLTFVFS